MSEQPHRLSGAIPMGTTEEFTAQEPAEQVIERMKAANEAGRQRHADWLERNDLTGSKPASDAGELPQTGNGVDSSPQEIDADGTPVETGDGNPGEQAAIEAAGADNLPVRKGNQELNLTGQGDATVAPWTQPSNEVEPHEVIEGEFVDDDELPPLPGKNELPVLEGEVDDTPAIPAPRGNVYRDRLVGEDDEGDVPPVSGRPGPFPPAAAGGQGGEGGGNPGGGERVPKHIKIAVDEVARLKTKLESRVGFGKKSTSKELQAALDKLREAIETETHGDRARQILLTTLADELITERRIELAPEKIKGLLPRFGHQLNRLTKWMGEHKKIVIGAGIGLAALATGGIALGVAAGGAGMATAAAWGAGLGGAKGAGLAYAKQRGRLAEENLRESVENRLAPSLTPTGDIAPGADTWYESSRELRDTRGRRTLGRTALGGILGATVGAVAGAAGAGYHDFLSGGGAEHAAQPDQGVETGTDTPPVGQEDIQGAIKDMLDHDPSQIPGVKFIESTPDAAASHYPGHFPLDSLQHGANLNNHDTFTSFTDGWTTLHDVPGVKIDSWGDIHFANGHYETTGNLWGGKITVDHLKVIDTNGDVHTFNGGLTPQQQAELLDLTRQLKGQDVSEHFFGGPDSNQQLAEVLSHKIDPTQLKEINLTQNYADTQAHDIATNYQADIQSDTPDAFQADISKYVSEHPQFVKLSNPDLDQYLAERVAAEAQNALGDNVPAWVNPNAIQQMIDDAVKAANAPGESAAEAAVGAGVSGRTEGAIGSLFGDAASATSRRTFGNN